jgi:hypothetical protein
MDKDGENIWNNTLFANSVQQMIETKVHHIKMIRVFAELRYEKYEALMEAGFSKEEALHLVTNTQILG